MPQEQETTKTNPNDWTLGAQIFAASMLTAAALLLTESNVPLALAAPPGSLDRWLRPLFIIAAWAWTGWQWREVIRLHRKKKHEQAKHTTGHGPI